MTPRTPIILITGSLGSGKTTLLRRILKGTGRRIAVLMNEFGEIAIDSRIIEGENIRIVELAGGCVCCSLTGEFEAAVREILDKVQPEYIVVEATGVAEADSLVFEVEDNLPEVRLDCVICIVDADISIRFPSVGYTTRTHLDAADIILINKADLVTRDQLREVEEQVRRYSHTGAILQTVECQVDIELLFGLNRPGAGTVRERPLTMSGQHFQSFTYTTGNLLDKQAFCNFAENLPDKVFRAKGFVRTEEGGFLFNYVAGRTDLEQWQVDKSQLVFIGRGLTALREDILQQLHECEKPNAV